jgi:Flp pilus assembly protein TadG
MKRHPDMPRRARHARGVAAVELAIIMMLFMFILPATFLFGRVFWQYNVLKNATDNAARFLARSPVADLATNKAVADNLVRSTIHDAGMDTSAGLVVEVLCVGSPGCMGGTPTGITINALVNIDDPAFIDGFTGLWLPNGTWPVVATSTTGYPY